MNINCAIRARSLYPSIPKTYNPSPAAPTTATAHERAVDHQKSKADTCSMEKLPEYASIECNAESLKLAHLAIDASFELMDISRQYREFYERVEDLRPDITSKGFGFTLDEDGKIKILDSGQQLSDADKSWLTEEINAFKDIRLHVNKHATLLMELVEIDTEKFGREYKLNARNFQSTIDYRDILNEQWTTRGVSMDEHFTQQILENAEKRPSTLFETYA